MEHLNNPMAQLANLFNVVEAQLRRAAADNKYIGLHDLYKIPEVRAAAKNRGQVKNVLKNFREHGHLISTGTSRWTTYIWNVDSPPFVLSVKMHQQAAREPSEVKVHATDAAKQLEKAWAGEDVDGNQPVRMVPGTSEEIELVLNGRLIVVGTNPATNRLRIIIEG